MNIYHAHGRDQHRNSFSFVVRAETEETARRLVLDVMNEDPIQFYCNRVGLALEGETDETVIW